jgi:hypothetical protein
MYIAKIQELLDTVSNRINAGYATPIGKLAITVDAHECAPDLQVAEIYFNYFQGRLSRACICNIIVTEIDGGWYSGITSVNPSPVMGFGIFTSTEINLLLDYARENPNLQVMFVADIVDGVIEVKEISAIHPLYDHSSYAASNPEKAVELLLKNSQYELQNLRKRVEAQMDEVAMIESHLLGIQKGGF